MRGISDLIVHPGLINVDFADVKTIMSNMGRALMGTGYGKGKDRALEAARMAIASPLLDEVSVSGATGVLLNFTAGPDVRLSEIEAAASLVQESAHEDANIIFGVHGARRATWQGHVTATARNDGAHSKRCA